MKSLVIAIALMLGIVGCSKDDSWKRGDRVEMVTSNPFLAEAFKGCKLTFIASVATKDSNKAFIYVEDCTNDWIECPLATVVDLDNLRKL